MANEIKGLVNTTTGVAVADADVRYLNFLDWKVTRTSTAVSANTTTQTIIGVTDNSSARTITLDTDDVVDGRIIIIKDEAGTAASANNITIDTEGAELIDGAASITITANYGVARVYSNGTNWFSW